MPLAALKRAVVSPRALPMLPIVVGFALRVFRLGHQELRGDEAFGYFFSLPPLGEIVRQTLALQEPHPVGSYLLQHAWLRVAGHSEFALRFVSAWFGALAVALAFRLARLAGLSTRSAVAAAALLAVSPYAIWHSQDARMYSISLALTLTTTLLTLAFVQRPRPGRGVAYVLAALAALHVHYFAAFVIVAQNIWVLWLVARQRRTALLLRWLAVQAAVAVLYAPWLAAAWGTLRTYHGNADSPTALAALARVARVFLTGEAAPPAIAAAAVAVAACLLILLLLILRSRPGAPPRLSLIALTLAVPLLATWISATGRPIFNERYLIAAAPGLYLLLAAALDASPGVRKSAAVREKLAPLLLTALLMLGLVGAGYYYFDPAASKTRGWRQLAGVLQGFTRGFAPGEAWVGANSPDPTLWYYYPSQQERWAVPPAARDRAGAGHMVDELAQKGVLRVVAPLVRDDAWDGEGIARDALAARYPLLLTRAVAGWDVVVAESLPARPRPVAGAFAEGFRLEAAGWRPETPRAGGLLGVHLRWSQPALAVAGAKVTVQLLDPAGALAAQSDVPLPRESGWSSHGLLLPPDLAPGAYRLIAAVYDPDAPGFPRSQLATGADAVELAVIMIS